MSVLDDEVWPMVNRAKDNAQELRTVLDTWQDRNPKPYRRERHDEGRLYTVHWLFDPPEPQRHWGCIFGDVMHNLRSALDHLVWQLVLNDNGNPGTWNEFPVFDDPARYVNDSKRDLRGITSAPVRALVESYQPYNPIPAGIVLDTPSIHPLWVIHEFDRKHKHQVVHAPLQIPGGVSGPIEVEALTTVVPTASIFDGVAEHDAMFASIAVDGPSIDMTMDLVTPLQVCVEPSPGTYIRVRQAMDTCEKFIDHVIRDFGQFFP